MHLPWDMALSTWTSYPTNGIENPITDVWSLGGAWPSAIVDDAGKNPATEDLTKPPPGSFGIKGSFGPAVDASVKLVRSPVTSSLPNWNLDGDRGRGWLTWQLPGLYTTPVPAVPEI